MGRHAGGGRKRCESSCLSVDVRQWCRQGLLRPAGRFTHSWICNEKPLGSIDVRTTADAVFMTFKGSRPWKSPEQRVSLVWTRCHLGGRRLWFRCSECGRRVAKLYMRDEVSFACRQCCGLGYASQLEIPRHRAISQAQKIRMRLGGASANLLEPLPQRPRGMHRRTYYRRFTSALAAQERAIALMVDHLERRDPWLRHR
jgi:hypothetical protein